jgi:2-polyprenyl-6-methoxyphenol hydroxylase-like FAD-dependent oxidoreductase
MSQPSQPKAEHAIVLGASMGGLLAARALAPHFARVTIIERDELPTEPVNRKGVPQGRHSHALLAKGGEVLESLFPGLSQQLIDLGAPSGDPGLVWRLIAGGQRCAPDVTGLQGLAVSRPLLEYHVRRRVLALPQVNLIARHIARGLIVGSGDRVTGVRIAAVEEPATEREILADLVVDASGRASKTPEWLGDLGFPAPEAESVQINVSYVTRHFRRRPGDHGGDLATVISAVPPNRRAGAALAQEGDRWTVTLIGYLGERAPLDLPGFIEFARGLPTLDIYDLVSRAEPIGEPCTAAYPASTRRRYERLRRFPERFVVFGDAICGFNPIFGQGMTVAAIEATLLDETVAEGLDQIGPRFFARTTRPLDAPWSIVVGNDLRFPDARGERTLTLRLINAYLTRFLKAAAHDAVLSRAFFDVCNLTSAPEHLLSPSLLARVFFRRRPSVTRALPATTTPA